jgi:RES domain
LLQIIGKGGERRLAWRLPMTEFLLCSECFRDEGLKLDAMQFGVADDTPCPNCGKKDGRKLAKESIIDLAQRFVVWGTLLRLDYGGAPRIQFNDRHPTDIKLAAWLEADLRPIEGTSGMGFFHYGPRAWMVGEVEPLKALQDPTTRAPIVERILAEYPAIPVSSETTFYRVRKAPAHPNNPDEYDSPPAASLGSNRFDTKDHPVMYASPDLQVCVHEMRVAAEDDLYVAALSATKELKLLDLSEVLREEGVTEFESLDMAVYMICLAGSHSYEICRAIAVAAKNGGYDGLLYPSYFSLLRTGHMPFETIYGISHRRFSQLALRERSKNILNFALVGRPIKSGLVQIRSIDRLVVNQVEYRFHFGPVGYD